MKQIWRVGLALAAFGFLAGVGLIAQERQPAGSRMASTAQAFLALLNPEQRSAATFPFDDPERVNWDFVPLQDKEKNSTRTGRCAGKNDPRTEDRQPWGFCLPALSPGGFESGQHHHELRGNLLTEGSGSRARRWCEIRAGISSLCSANLRRLPNGDSASEGHHLTVNIHARRRQGHFDDPDGFRLESGGRSGRAA